MNKDVMGAEVSERELLMTARSVRLEKDETVVRMLNPSRVNDVSRINNLTKPWSIYPLILVG